MQNNYADHLMLDARIILVWYPFKFCVSAFMQLAKETSPFFRERERVSEQASPRC